MTAPSPVLHKVIALVIAAAEDCSQSAMATQLSLNLLTLSWGRTC